MKLLKNTSMMGVFVLCLLVATGLVQGAGEGVPEMIKCDAQIKWEVVKEAKINQFECTVSEHGGQPALIFTVGIMNPTDKPLRYRINIFLEDMDKAAGHLVPRKGKPPVVEPDKSTTVKIPFIGTDKESKQVLVVVKTIST
jgi:hypothetical protein